MTIFCIGNSKGGVGKSTISVQVTTSLAMAGSNVWHVDGNRKQTSSLLALSSRAGAGLDGIPAVELSDGKALRAQVALQAPKFDHTVIDIGAGDTGALRAALFVADVLVAPFAPRSFDAWAYENLVELVQESGRDLPVVPFLNMADPSGQEADNDATCAEIASYGFKVAPVRIGRRKAIAHASARGQNVHEYHVADQKAMDEIDALMQFLLQNYGGNTSDIHRSDV